MADDRTSPLRGNLSHEELVLATRSTHKALSTLRDDHYSILSSIRDEADLGRMKRGCHKCGLDNTCNCSQENDDDVALAARIAHVSQSLDRLEMGVEETGALLALSEHFSTLEAERATMRLEMSRVLDENAWLRDELRHTEDRLQEALLELTDLQEEKTKWDFAEELQRVGSESNVRPVTPSKIPVGAFRVEEEKNINRALLGLGPEKSDKTRSSSPAVVSRIPMGSWRSKVATYKAVMEKEDLRAAQVAADKADRSKRQYFSLNAANGTANGAKASNTKIPAR